MKTEHLDRAEYWFKFADDWRDLARTVGLLSGVALDQHLDRCADGARRCEAYGVEALARALGIL